MEKKHWKRIKLLSFLMVFVISLSFGAYVTLVRTDENKTESTLDKSSYFTLEKMQKVVIFTDITFLLIYAFAKSKSD